MINLRCATIWTVAIALAACAPPEERQATSPEADLAAIGEVRDQLIAALRADDIPGILAGLTADHITMAPNTPALANEEALTSWHQGRIDEYTFGSTFSSEDIRLEGDYAIEWWSAVTRLTPKAGGADIEDKNKGLWVWQRQPDGSWKLLWSIWNSDNPVEPSE